MFLHDLLEVLGGCIRSIVVVFPLGTEPMDLMAPGQGLAQQVEPGCCCSGAGGAPGLAVAAVAAAAQPVPSEEPRAPWGSAGPRPWGSSASARAAGLDSASFVPLAALAQQLPSAQGTAMAAGQVGVSFSVCARQKCQSLP